MKLVVSLCGNVNCIKLTVEVGKLKKNSDMLFIDLSFYVNEMSEQQNSSRVRVAADTFLSIFFSVCFANTQN